MQKHLHNNDEGFDKAMKESLQNYEAPFTTESWASIENAIGEPSVSSPLKKISFSLNSTTIGIIGGGIILAVLTIWAFSGDSKNETAQAPAVKTQSAIATFISPNVSPFVYTSEIPLPVHIEKVTEAAPYDNSDLAYADSLVRAEENMAQLAKEEKNNIDEVVPAKEEPIKPEEEGFDAAFQKERTIFGDQIDPVKGIVSDTKEEDELKRIAAKKDPFSWNGLKIDDIKKDSLRKRNMADSLMKIIKKQQ